MTHVCHRAGKALRRWALAGCFALASASPSPALAAPGAHGPDGEHLDAPAQAQGPAGSGPRFEASSGAFEMVGRLQGGELSMFISRFETGEPVLDAKVELESDGLRAVATFHKDLGDYAVDDEAFLAALSRPGQHPLIITLISGDESDLLESMLKVVPGPGARGSANDDEHPHEPRYDTIIVRSLLFIAGFSLLAALGWLFSRRRPSASIDGGVR